MAIGFRKETEACALRRTTMSHKGPSELRILFYVEQDYGFAILRPLQDLARSKGHDVRWLLVENASANNLGINETACTTVQAAIDFRPDAVISPGDRIPSFIPGLKVQVFHGLNEDKRDREYPERGLFDLYCTEGPARTRTLAPLADQRGYFQVRETGWLKLDAILKGHDKRTDHDRPQILFASTFTPRLSSAEELHGTVKKLSQSPQWQWLVTLHPKMAPETVRKYKALTNENLSYHETGEVIDLLHRADVMVSDNSSILQEFLLLEKPVVTFKNRDPQPFLLDISEPAALEATIRQALDADAGLRNAIAAYGPSVTPFLDGASSARVLAAIEGMFGDGWRDRKPANLWRNLKMRQQLNYYRFW